MSLIDSSFTKLLGNELSDFSFVDLFALERERKREEFSRQMGGISKKKIDGDQFRLMTDLDKLSNEIQAAMAELREVQPEHFDLIEKVVKAAFVAGLEVGEHGSIASVYELHESGKHRKIGNVRSIKVRHPKAEAEKKRIESAVAEIQKKSNLELKKSEIITRLRKNYGVTLGKTELYEILKNLR